MDEPETRVHKRHKKHKKKHKRRHREEEENPTPVPAIKLKIKIGQETLGEKSVTKTELVREVSDRSANEESDEQEPELEPELETELPLVDDAAAESASDSDDEQAWLVALEAGELDENGALKSKKAEEKKTLTKRQKALIESKNKDNDDIMYAWYPTLSPAELERRKERAEKRRRISREKRENDKKISLERLLKKREARARARVRSTEPRHPGSERENIPRIRYLQTKTSVRISYPPNMDIPIPTLKAPEVPRPVLCAVEGCQNPKKYSCSKTHRPLCSLECYKKNLATILSVDDVRPR